MILRFTYVNFLPERLQEAKRIYNEEIVPVIKRQKGNIDCKLLEPENKTDDYISMTIWETKADADEYESSGTYKELVNKLRKDFSKAPVLKVYSAENVLQSA